MHKSEISADHPRSGRRSYPAKGILRGRHDRSVVEVCLTPPRLLTHQRARKNCAAASGHPRALINAKALGPRPHKALPLFCESGKRLRSFPSARSRLLSPHNELENCLKVACSDWQIARMI